MNYSRIIALYTSVGLLSGGLLFNSPSYSALMDDEQQAIESTQLIIDEQNYDKREILVKFTDNASKSMARVKQGKAMQALSKHGSYSVRRLAKANTESRTKHRPAARAAIAAMNRWHVVELPETMTVEAAMTMLEDDADVEAVELNHVVYVDTVPNDPRYDELWGLNNVGQTGGTPGADIDAETAWNISTGESTVIVGVLDSGVDYTHEDLAENMWVNPGEIPGNGIDDDNNGYIDDVHGYDFQNNDGDPMDDHGHGTHVSGTIAAVGNNGIGVTGVNWQAQIMALKFINRMGYGDIADAVEALAYATSMGVRITNNSWGRAAESQSLYDAIAAANEAGVLVVASAGNSSRPIDGTPHMPASFDLPNVLSVAATDHNDQLAWFSNWGAVAVDLAAPGVNVLSTARPSLCPLCNFSGYGRASGTSMATPHVVGAAALLLSQVPSLTTAELKAWLMESVDKLPELAETSVTEGRLNIANALADTDYRVTFSPSPVGIRQGESATVTVTVSTFDRFSGPLTLSTETSHPSIAVELSSNQVDAQPGDVIEIAATLSVDATLHADRHSLTITSVNPSGEQKVSTIYVDVIGPDFALSVAPSSKTLQSGESTQFAVNIQSIESHIGPISLNVESPHPTIGATLSSSFISLPANGSEETTLTVDTTIATPAGDYAVRIAGSDEEATRDAFAMLNVPAVVDLTVPTATLPTQIGELGRFNVEFTAENLGNTTSSWIVWGLYLSTDPQVTTSDQLIAEDIIFLELPPLTGTDVSKDVTLPSGISAGSYYLGVIVDHSNHIDEPNEDNNTASASVDIVNFDADVTVTSATPNQSSLTSGESLTVTATVANLGSNTADAVDVDVYLSLDDYIDSSDFLLGSDNVRLNGQAEANVAITAPALVDAGQYRIGVIVDGTNAIDESDENNNVGLGGTVDVTTGRDLVVSAVTAPPQAALGEIINIDVTITNQGGADAQGLAAWHVYLSEDSTITREDRWLNFGYAYNLAAGESQTQSRTGRLPTGITTGQYYIGVIVDRDDAIVESDETNNTGATAIDVTVSQ